MGARKLNLAAAQNKPRKYCCLLDLPVRSGLPLSSVSLYRSPTRAGFRLDPRKVPARVSAHTPHSAGKGWRPGWPDGRWGEGAPLSFPPTSAYLQLSHHRKCTLGVWLVIPGHSHPEALRSSLREADKQPARNSPKPFSDLFAMIVSS